MNGEAREARGWVDRKHHFVRVEKRVVRWCSPSESDCFGKLIHADRHQPQMLLKEGMEKKGREGGRKGKSIQIQMHESADCVILYTCALVFMMDPVIVESDAK